jgi:hypothetical protein
LDTLDNSFSPLIFLISNVIEPYQEGILISNNFFIPHMHIQKVNCNYSKFKTNFGLEKYLCILKSFEQRRNFTRFCISSHRLQIERGQYQGALPKRGF